MRFLVGLGFGLMAGLLPALAQEQTPMQAQVQAREPTIWRDPVHGCAYLLPPQGGIGPRYAPDGRPDCAGATADPTPTGAVAPPVPQAPSPDAACLLFSATCVTRDAALVASRTLEISGSSLPDPAP